MRKNRLFIVVILISLLLFLISCGNREVSVKFNSNGGTTIETKFVAQGTIVDEPDISKEGYSFGGWFEEESFIESSLFDFTRPVNRNIVLYAKWNINSYTINFHHNNDDEDTVLTINFNDTINYPVIEKENYVFQGWYISSNFNGNPYDKEKMPASNLNLYAKWEIKTYEVTFLNGEQVVKRVTVNHGDDLLENEIPNPPKVTGKVTYWDLDVDLTNITKNIEVNLKMDDKYYLVTISDSDNNIYLSEEVKHGESFIVPTSFEKVGYQFEGYLHYLPNEELIITNDLEIIVSFIPIVYQVIFRDQDDVVIDTRNVNHGNKVSEPNINIPEHYEKDGWYEENSLINFTFDTPISSNLTLKLKVTAKEYQMIFNGNGGVFSSNEETNIIKKTYNEIVGIPEAPTKEGFSFSGWYDNPELTGNIVSFSPQTRMSGNVTYYAKWSAKTYQITYNNVIDIEHRNPKTYNINTNDITLSNPFEREGYTFNGWYKEDDFVTKVTTIEKGSFGDITLYGKWDINQYTITFNTNGGNEIAPLVLNYEEEIIKPVDPIRLGYTFNGWNKVIPSNMPAENLSFTANWTIINYQITYHLDGGNHSNNPLTYNVLTNTIILNEGTKEGYTFIGWFDEVALGSLIVEINKGTIGDIELYARYEINKYTVTFLDYDDTVLKVEENVSWNTDATAPSDPTRTGYSFTGWDILFINVKEDLTVKAIYQVNTYDITYHLDNGVNHSSNPIKYTIETETITLEPANKEGYTFIGWYDAETEGTKVTTIINGSTGNVELYARFEINTFEVTFKDYNGDVLKSETVNWNEPASAPDDPSRTGYSFTGWDEEFSNVKDDLVVTAQYTINEYTITFDTNGGTSISPITQDYDTLVTAPDNPTKLGYTFDGWNKGIPSNMPAEDITITASWKVVEYDITYNLDDGINDPSNPSKYTIETEIITLEPANKEGYTFVGWYDLEVEGTKVITIINGSTGNVELYARFEINTFEVTFKDHDGSILKVQENVPWNTGATAPINPTRLGYSFTGWDVDFSNVKSDLTVTAQYTINEYTITFDTNGGTSISPIKQDYDTSVTAPDNPTKLGYTFDGWDVEVPTTMPAEDITITASWKVVEYDITYHLDDGTNNPSNPSEYTIETETITLLPASKDGYSFVGWYDAETEGLQVTTITKGSIGNKELYARFEIKKYTVTFIDYDETELKVQGNVPWNTGATAPSDPSRLGYSFTGWDEDFTNVKDDLVVTALYSINYYTITYEGLDSIASNNPSTYTILDRIIFNDPETKLGYAFIGWYDDLEDGELVLGINKGSYGNITLYAYFEESFSYYDVNINYLFVEYTDLDINHGTGDETKTLSDTYMESNILHGSEFSPVVSMDGYIFYKYEIIDDNNEYGFNDLITIDKAGIEINVYYRKIINEIVFIQRGATWPTNPFDYDQIYKYLQYGEDLDSSEIPELTDYDGETVIWDREVFNDIKQNITVSALYFSNSSKTIRFIDGNRTVLIISQGELLDTDTFITSESPIWKMTKSGYHFEGWFIDDVLFVIGDYTFDQITGNQIVITTKWTELKKYNTPTNMDFIINEEDDEYEFIIKWELDLVVKGEQLEEPLFELYLDNNLVGQFEVIKSDGKYILTIDTNHEKYETLLALTEVGTHVIEIRALGNGETTTNSNKSRFEYIRKSIFDEDPDQVDVYDYFIIEEFRGVKRYILYTNMVYQFSNTSVVDVISGIDLFDTAPNNYTLKTNNIPGSFRFKITKDGEFIIYEGLIVKDIKQFTYGSSYQQYIDVEDINKTSYLVGNQNDFYFDLRMRNTKGEQIRINDVELEYEVSILDGTESPLEEGDFNTFFTFEPNNRIRFTSEAINKTFKFKVASKYQANKMTLGGLEYIITVNDGYNAFTNQDLKDLYGNLDVDLINIHANIKAELAPSQLNTDGSPKNTKNGLGNVYNRNNTSNNDDQITIEGNYMLIDGSDLPYSNINSGGGEVGFGSAFPIVNVQIAIFNYNMGTYKIENEIPTYNNSKLTMNNLMIVGNTRTPSVNYASSIEEILYQEGLMSKNSGGFIGVMVNNGSSEFNNVEVKYGVIGFSNYAYGLASENNEIEMKLNEVFVSDSWANGVYMQGATLLTINDSYLGRSGGPAFHVSDIRKNGGINNPTIVINNTVVDNYVSGQEAWFKAYNMSSIALGMKQMIESGIEDTGRSIIKLNQDPVTKIETEMINLVLLTEPKAEAIQKEGEDNVTSASEVVLIIDGITLNRSYDYLTSGDPRIMGENFVFPIGEYSDLLSGFQGLLNGIEQIAIAYDIPLDQGQISNIASLAAFYNLTAAQVMGTLNEYGEIDSGLLTQALGDNKANNIYPPEYLEVLHKADIFSLAGVTEGYSVIIIGLEA